MTHINTNEKLTHQSLTTIPILFTNKHPTLMKFIMSLLLLLCFNVATLFAWDPPQVEETTELTELQTEEIKQLAAYYTYIDSIENTFQFEKGEVSILRDQVKINVPEGFKFLNGKDSEMILVDLWGNPPSEAGDKSLGMLIPDSSSAIMPVYSINITYSDEGHIKDEDAKDIDYDELLAEMQQGSIEANEERERLGYGKMSMVGWAKPPYYDAETKKLYWAQELDFGDEMNTLNYNIRVLGRKGYLNLNAISTMDYLSLVDENIDPILTSVNFTEGNSYADFDPKLDKVAAYGIGGLIAGKVLMKAGILAKFGVVLAKFWKIIAVGFIAITAGIRKFFGRKEETDQQIKH